MIFLPNLKVSTPATIKQIDYAERELNLKFSNEYKLYLLKYGCIEFYGVELTGIIDSKRLNVIDVTKKERLYNPNIPNNMYVIENAAINGIIIWQDDKGYIYKTQYTSNTIKIFNSLSEYLISCVSKIKLRDYVQSIIINGNIDMSKVRMVEDLYKKEIDNKLVMRIISSSEETKFFDDNIRSLSFNEIIEAENDLHVDFKSKGLLPLFDCGDNDFIVYHLYDKTWSKFNITDNTIFKRSISLIDIL